MSKVTNPDKNVLIAVGAGAAAVVVGRFAWKRLKNRKASK